MIAQERIQRFWEWCGFEFHLSASENPHYWRAPDGKSLSELPPIDFNSLFQYAVPKILDEGYLFLRVLFNDWVEELEEDKDPATALFLVIERVIKEGE